MENLELKGGALIIGSLLWQDDLSVEDEDKIRKEWRENKLGTGTIKVRLPIRYGRLSRGGIFTMVFSKKCEIENLSGTSYVKPFKSPSINNWNDLEVQAIEMSKAEGMNGKFIGGKRNIWCTMSIIFNPKIEDKQKGFLLKKWKEKVIENGGGNDLGEYKFGDEESAIKENCSLNFDWFEPVNKEDKSKIDALDFIICTVTKQKNPKSENYPSISEIANTVKNDTKRKYFKNNVANGISTFEDKSILEET